MPHSIDEVCVPGSLVGDSSVTAGHALLLCMVYSRTQSSQHRQWDRYLMTWNIVRPTAGSQPNFATTQLFIQAWRNGNIVRTTGKKVKNSPKSQSRWQQLLSIFGRLSDGGQVKIKPTCCRACINKSQPIKLQYKHCVRFTRLRAVMCTEGVPLTAQLNKGQTAEASDPWMWLKPK